MPRKTTSKKELEKRLNTANQVRLACLIGIIIVIVFIIIVVVIVIGVVIIYYKFLFLLLNCLSFIF